MTGVSVALRPPYGHMASPYKAPLIWAKHFSRNARRNRHTDLNLGEDVYRYQSSIIPAF